MVGVAALKTLALYVVKPRFQSIDVIVIGLRMITIFEAAIEGLSFTLFFLSWKLLRIRTTTCYMRQPSSRPSPSKSLPPINSLIPDQCPLKTQIVALSQSLTLA